MASKLHLEMALTPDGWRRDVVIGIDHGIIASVESPATPGRAPLRRRVPGLPNLHSHAFQRAMAGLTERRGSEADSFWTWREQMYRFVERLTPDDLEAIAAFAYMEMLEAGFTWVAEFHYLHHQPDGRPYDNVAEMSERIVAAADAVGHRPHPAAGALSPERLRRQAADAGAAPLPERPRLLCAADGDQGARRPHRHRARTRCAPSRSTICKWAAAHLARPAGAHPCQPSRRARSRTASPRTAAGRSTC